MKSRCDNCMVKRSFCPALVSSKSHATKYEIMRREMVCEEKRIIIDQSKPIFD